MPTIKRSSRRGKPAQRRLPQPLEPAPHNGDVLLVGAAAIARELDQPLPRIFDWLKRRLIKSAKKTGDLWTAGRNALRREFNLDVS